MAGLDTLAQLNLVICTVLLVWCQQCFASPRSLPVGASVKTSSGLILGHAGPQFPDVSEYLGIPYASPPTDQLRFAAPAPLDSKETVLANTYNDTLPWYPGSTPQASRIISAFLQQPGPQSEDCLYLNIWTKPDSNKLKPVLLWIHGGRFVITGAESSFYDGQVLASKHEVLLVTINYRLNIFGFSGAPNLPQNVGLLDQRMAVEWVHRNIKGFGGDPNRITLFGSSAGGTSVDFYSYAWAHNPLVSGLISHSGTALSYIPNTIEQSTDAFYNVSRSLGCGDRSEKPDRVLECMREKPWEDIFNISNSYPQITSATVPEPVFHPVADEVTVFSDYKKRSAEGKFARLPYLVTCNNNEAGFYRLSAYASNITVSDSSWNKFNLAAFTCPSGETMRYRTSHGVPAWQARYFGDWDTLRLYPGSGTYHASDLSVVFGNTKKVSGIPDSDALKEFSTYMASAWVAFASDPEHGLDRFGWPRYNPHEKTLVGLAYANSTVEFFNPQQFERGCASLKGGLLLGAGAI